MKYKDERYYRLGGTVLDYQVAGAEWHILCVTPRDADKVVDLLNTLDMLEKRLLNIETESA